MQPSNSLLTALYDLNRSQGLNHYGDLGHVAHKFTRVIFKFMTSDTSFSLANLVA